MAIISTDKTREVPESAVETHSSLPGSAVEMHSKWDYVRWFFDWFCGLDSSTANSAPKQMRQLRDMTSLHQTHGARTALYTALTVLITLDIFLYVFFSSGSDFGLLRNNLLISESLFANVTMTNQSAILRNHLIGT